METWGGQEAIGKKSLHGHFLIGTGGEGGIFRHEHLTIVNY
jgi:hypothetical protein